MVRPPADRVSTRDVVWTSIGGDCGPASLNSDTSELTDARLLGRLLPVITSQHIIITNRRQTDTRSTTSFSSTIWVRRHWVAVASAGPYANYLHLAPDRQPCQHFINHFFTDWMLFLTPNQQCQSNEGKTPSKTNIKTMKSNVYLQHS